MDAHETNRKLIEGVANEFRPYAVVRQTHLYQGDALFYRDGKISFAYYWQGPKHFSLGAANHGHEVIILTFDDIRVVIGINGAYMWPIKDHGYCDQDRREITRDTVFGAIDRAYLILAQGVARRTLLDVAARLRDKSAGFKALKMATDVAREVEAIG